MVTKQTQERRLVEEAIAHIRENPDSYELEDVVKQVDLCDIVLEVEEFGEVVLHKTGYYAFSFTDDGDVSWSFNTGTDNEISVDGERGEASARAGDVESEFYMDNGHGGKSPRYFNIVVDDIPEWLKGPEFENDGEEEEEKTETSFEKPVNPETKYYNVFKNFPKDGWHTVEELVEIVSQKYDQTDVRTALNSLREKRAVESRTHPEGGPTKQYRVTEHGRSELERLGG